MQQKGRARTKSIGCNTKSLYNQQEQDELIFESEIPVHVNPFYFKHHSHPDYESEEEEAKMFKRRMVYNQAPKSSKPATSQAVPVVEVKQPEYVATPTRKKEKKHKKKSRSRGDDYEKEGEWIGFVVVGLINIFYTLVT